MTKVTARPMPAAVSTLFDTPRKGQQPRKREKMKLWLSTQLTKKSSTLPQLLVCITGVIYAASFAFFFFSMLFIMMLATPRVRPNIIKPPGAMVVMSIGS